MDGLDTSEVDVAVLFIQYLEGEWTNKKTFPS